MKKSILLSALLATSNLSVAAENSGKREVLLDNDKVEVIRLTYPVGTESGMHNHSHPNRVVYFVKGGKLALIPADKTKAPTIMKVDDGQTLYLPSMSHNVKNIGDSEVVIVETEIKQ